MPALDETDLAARLRGLSAAQPAQPTDRVSAVRGRAAATRRRRALGAAVAVALVAGAPAALLATRDAAPPVPVVAVVTTTPVGAWPDRSLPDDRGVAEGALQAWRTSAEQPLPRDAPVRWLFRGAAPRGGQQATSVAVFLVGGDGPGQRLVTAHAERDQLDDRGVDVGGPDPGGSPWRTQEVRVQDAGSHVGLYLPGQEAGDNTLFVLADPAARELAWSAQAVPYAPPAGTSGARRSGTTSSPDGVFVEDAGPLDGLVQVQVAGPALPVQAHRPLTATGRPDLVDAPPVVLPAGQGEWAELDGQSDWQDGDGLAGGSPSGGYEVASGLQDDRLTGTTGRWAVHATCYGGGRLRLALLGERGSVPCDGQQHVPFPVVDRPDREGYHLRLEAQGLIVYRVAVATLP